MDKARLFNGDLDDLYKKNKKKGVLEDVDNYHSLTLYFTGFGFALMAASFEAVPVSFFAGGLISIMSSTTFSSNTLASDSCFTPPTDFDVKVVPFDPPVEEEDDVDPEATSAGFDDTEELEETVAAVGGCFPSSK